MNPMMLWDAEMSDALSGPEEEGTISVDKEWYNLPVSDEKLLAGLPTVLQEMYTHANGVEIRWSSVADSSQGGRVLFSELEHVLRGGLGQVYENEDLAQEELLEFFKPFDLVTDESECGFLLRPGSKPGAIYYHVSGRPELHNLDIDLKGYLAMAIAARAYFHWPKVLLDLQSGEEGAETADFKKNMPKLFPDFNWEEFKETYRSLRLSTK